MHFLMLLFTFLYFSDPLGLNLITCSMVAVTTCVCMFQVGCHPLCACTKVNIITHVHALWSMSQLCACSRVDVTTCVHVPGWMLFFMCMYQGENHHSCAHFMVDVSIVCMFQDGCHHLCACSRVDVILYVHVPG